MGMTMSATRRMLLLNWAARTGAWIIEDDYDSEYRFGGHPIASLQSLDTSARVIYVGTFNKVMFPALRLGYLVVPKDLVPAFASARDATDVFFVHAVSGGDDRFYSRGTFRATYPADAHPLYAEKKGSGRNDSEATGG